MTLGSVCHPRAFRYFPRKEDLVGLPFEDEVEPWVRAFRERPAGERFDEAVRAAAGALGRDHRRDPEAWRRRRALIDGDPALRERRRGAAMVRQQRLADAIAARLTLDVGDPRVPALAAGALAAFEVASAAWARRPEAERTSERYEAELDAAHRRLASVEECLTTPVG
ncbi:hypothetical protein ER308_20350 [Egibacter rhizosphaerae]|uniref:MftR C-terminal domain-containing protein n=1 Tax=Egibacter rhizosphaerae TaxID=1670831 RepID=A0A411YKH0_9ACTN|nr:hypothetical protein [Egibacter rhizosphaerae]QBI21686.1 hypothetical protein ER308_20350 [Egibacter rhizosphaerae]